MLIFTANTSAQSGNLFLLFTSYIFSSPYISFHQEPSS
ncbi:unknown [Prevotella sp. CAG:732]|nr:unknown [Prevotella sp. CAG:732]